jgi:hypothetical protein
MTVNVYNETGPVTDCDTNCRDLLLLISGRNILGWSANQLLVSEQMQWRTAVKTIGGFMVLHKVGNFDCELNSECVPIG